MPGPSSSVTPASYELTVTADGDVTWRRETSVMPSNRPPEDDPVPLGILLDLDEALRLLEALEDARLALRDAGAAPGLRDELATMVNLLHGRLGFDLGGLQ
jgi:hypothetical protein